MSLGQLELSDTGGTETITGPAAGVTISAGGNSRVFQVDSGVTASILGLTITGGSASNGGGLYNDGGNLTLTDCTVSGNSSSGNGGGVYTRGGTTTLIDCSISGNSAFQAGVFVANGTTVLTGCTVSGNTGSYGAGLYAGAAGTMTLTNCTVSGNSATVNGGGVYSRGTTTLTDCTVSGNTAGSDGGGLECISGGTSTLILTNCTVSGNTASSNGGGLYNNGGTTILGNTIVAVNTAGSGPDVFGGVTSQGNNLIGETDGSSGWVASDLTGTPATPLDAMLGPLGNYGGPTQTMAPLARQPGHRRRQ